MATNKKLIEDQENLKSLKARKRELSSTIERAHKELALIEDRIYQAQQVTSVIDGVAVAVTRYPGNRGASMQTLASGGNISMRNAKVYQRADTPYWAVSVNRFVAGQLKFHGGRVVGLADTLTQRQAQQVANRWLTGDDSVLNYRSKNN